MNNEDKLIVEGLASISKEVKESAVTVTRDEARFLVDSYYQIQASRIASDNQIRSIIKGVDGEGNEAPLALQWISKNSSNQETQIKKMLDYYTSNDPVGQWAKSTIGIGPVLAAGVLANFDINKCNHYNQFWSFCGLNDNNNPWLGIEKAKKLVKEIYDGLEEEDSYVSPDVFKSTILDKAMEKEFKKLMKSDHYADEFTAYLYGILKESSGYPAITELLLIREAFSGDVERVSDFLVRHYADKNAVTGVVIQKVCAKARRTMRSVNTGLNNVVINRKVKSKTINYTRSHLESYLAKPPYNANAKQLCFLIGESFVKVSGKADSLYGRLYKERRALESQYNDEMKFKDQAAMYLAEKNWGKETESYKAYSEGKLPAVQLHRRAKRYATKMFISHLFEAMHMDKYKKPMTDKIYPIAHLDHSDYIGPENPFTDYISM